MNNWKWKENSTVRNTSEETAGGGTVRAVRAVRAIALDRQFHCIRTVHTYRFVIHSVLRAHRYRLCS
jgi:hypothetical protein